MRFTVVRLNRAFLGVAALILVVIIGLSYWEWKQFDLARSEVTLTQGILESVNRLFTSVLDAESGCRKHLLTSKDRHLESYQRAVKAVPAERANLESLLARRKGGPGSFQRFNSLVDLRLASLRRAIDLRREQGAAVALESLAGDRDERLTDEVRGIWTEVRSQEFARLVDARSEAETAAGRALLLTTVGSLILLAFFIAGNQTITREILARERALAEARNARDALKTTIASVGNGVLATDAKGRIVFANKVALSLLRVPEAEVVGMHFDDVFRIVNAFSRTKLESPLAKVSREGAIVALANHTVLIARDGTEIPIDGSGAPIFSDNGPIRGTVVVFNDITGRRQAEETGRLFASIVESSADGIISKDLNGIITSWNNGAARIFGYSAEEMIGRRISSILPPGLDDETPAVLERVKKGERFDQYETVRRTKSGRLVNVSITWSPIYDSMLRIVGASKIVRDVTERKQAEQRFHWAVEASPNGMVVVDENGKILLVNSETERLFGYTRQELIGQPVEILVPRPFAAKHPRHRKDFHADPHPRRMGKGLDLNGRRKDGSEFPLEIGLNPIETGQGRWVLSSIVDITERKRVEQERLESLAKDKALTAERALRDTEAELARVARALTVGEMAASIAHEVNQPLTGVVTNAEACLLWLGGETPRLDEARESLGRIIKDGYRASEVIRRIREFLTKGTQQTESVDINEAVQAAVDLVRAELLKSKVVLRFDLAAGLPPVRGDRIRLQQVVLNLIMNARDAMASVAGRSRELVITSHKLADDGVGVAVRDTGGGMDQQDLNRMFEAFYTTKPTGMGMGLAISRSIVEAHGGRISAALNDGPGLTVQFSLPLDRNPS